MPQYIPWEIADTSSISKIENNAKAEKLGRKNIKIVLKVGNKVYDNWKSIRVEKSLLDFAGSFNFAISNTYPYKPENWPIKLGDECAVEINDQQIIKGYIEDMPIKYDAENHAIAVAGRDITGDLVDCSHITPSEKKNTTVEDLVRMLCDPFDIDVIIDSTATGGVAKKVDFTNDPGTPVYETISKYCRQIATVLPVCYGDGKLTLTRSGTKRAADPLRLGVNIKAGDLDQSDRDRFSTYYVKGQDKETLDLPWASTKLNPSNSAQDATLTERERYRPLMVIADTEVNDEYCKNRSRWEAQTRAALSRKVTYEVQGWTQSDGVVWPLNALVDIKDGNLGIDTTLLIYRLAFELDQARGSTTKISVVKKDAFDLIYTPIETEKFSFG